MKVSLANLLKTEPEKMSDFVSEQKLMKTSELVESEQMLFITKGLIRFRAPGTACDGCFWNQIRPSARRAHLIL
jgi:hypothetical protein